MTAIRRRLIYVFCFAVWPVLVTLYICRRLQGESLLLAMGWSATACVMLAQYARVDELKKSNKGGIDELKASNRQSFEEHAARMAEINREQLAKIEEAVSKRVDALGDRVAELHEFAGVMAEGKARAEIDAALRRSSRPDVDTDFWTGTGPFEIFKET